MSGQASAFVARRRGGGWHVPGDELHNRFVRQLGIGLLNVVGRRQREPRQHRVLDDIKYRARSRQRLLELAHLKEGDQLAVTIHDSGAITFTPTRGVIDPDAAADSAREIIRRNDELFDRLSK